MNWLASLLKRSLVNCWEVTLKKAINHKLYVAFLISQINIIVLSAVAVHAV